MEMNIFILKQEGGGWKGSCLREGLQMLGDFFFLLQVLGRLLPTVNLGVLCTDI